MKRGCGYDILFFLMKYATTLLLTVLMAPPAMGSFSLEVVLAPSLSLPQGKVNSTSSSSKSVLEVGIGHFLGHAMDLLADPTVHVTGIDMNKRHLDTVFRQHEKADKSICFSEATISGKRIRKLTLFNGRLQMIKMDGTKTPFQSGSFDQVRMFRPYPRRSLWKTAKMRWQIGDPQFLAEDGWLEKIGSPFKPEDPSNLKKFFKEAWRLLKPGGSYQVASYYDEYDPERIKILLEEIGFVNVSVVETPLERHVEFMGKNDPESYEYQVTVYKPGFDSVIFGEDSL